MVVLDRQPGHDATPGRFTVGHVVAGLALICTSLIGLVWSILRQVQNTYGERDRLVWPLLVIAIGSLSMIWGIVLLVLDSEPYYLTPGFVMTGLGLVCFSILSKVGLLALVWRRTFALANRVPLIPILTALACLFLSSFVFQAAVTDSNVFIPARVLVGLGAICFSLYSIVSILESGTSSDVGERAAQCASSLSGVSRWGTSGRIGVGGVSEIGEPATNWRWTFSAPTISVEVGASFGVEDERVALRAAHAAV